MIQDNSGISRFSSEDPCPICGGHPEEPRGNGTRCFGFYSEDGVFAHCTREDHASNLKLHEGSDTYSHLLVGDCRCGRRHGEPGGVSDLGKIVATYEYTDLAGTPIHRTVRFEPKDFRQQSYKDGKWVWSMKGVGRVLYRLPEVTGAIMAGEWVIVGEGEKDADAGRELGFIVTTCPEGAEKWQPSFTDSLKGANVALIPHRDPKGLRHMEKVARDLLTAARTVKVIDLPGLTEEEDLYDWIQKGGTKEELEGLILTGPIFSPSPRESGLVKSLPVFTMADLEKEEAENTAPWYVPKFLRAGDLTLLGGEAKKSGKTTLVMHMLKAVASGSRFLGEPTISTGAIVLTEQGNNIIQAMRKAKITAEDHVLVTPYAKVATEKWGELIAMGAEACREREYGIFVIDTFTAFAKLRGSAENDVGEVQERLAPLLDAARVHDLAVIFTHHTNREGEIRGSSHFFADPDVIWTLKRPQGEHLPNVRRLEGLGRYDVVNTEFNVALEDIGYIYSGSTHQVERDRAKDRIRELLKGHNEKRTARRRSELKDEVGMSNGTFMRALSDMIDSGEVCTAPLPGAGPPIGVWRPTSRGSRPTSMRVGPEEHGVPQEEKPKDKPNPESDSSSGPDSRPPPRESGPEEEGVPLVTDEAGLAEMVEVLAEEPEIAFDVETYPRDETARSLDPRRGEVGVISLSGEAVTYVIDRKVLDAEAIREAIERSMQGKSIVAHNAPFDLQFLRRSVGYEHRGPVFDTLILDAMHFYACGPLAEKGSWRGFTKKDKESGYKKKLGEVCEKFLGISLDKEERLADWGGEITEEMLSYAAKDTAVLLPLKDT